LLPYISRILNATCKILIVRLPSHRWVTVQLVLGCIPVALSKSEGAGSVWTLVHLPGAHL